MSAAPDCEKLLAFLEKLPEIDLPAAENPSATAHLRMGIAGSSSDNLSYRSTRVCYVHHIQNKEDSHLERRRRSVGHPRHQDVFHWLLPHPPEWHVSGTACRKQGVRGSASITLPHRASSVATSWFSCARRTGNATTTSGELSRFRETRWKRPASRSPSTVRQFSGSACARRTARRSIESRLETFHTRLLSTRRHATAHPTCQSWFHPTSSSSWATIGSTPATA